MIYSPIYKIPLYNSSNNHSIYRSDRCPISKIPSTRKTNKNTKKFIFDVLTALLFSVFLIAYISIILCATKRNLLNNSKLYIKFLVCLVSLVTIIYFILIINYVNKILTKEEDPEAKAKSSAYSISKRMHEETAEILIDKEKNAYDILCDLSFKIYDIPGMLYLIVHNFNKYKNTIILNDAIEISHEINSCIYKLNILQQNTNTSIPFYRSELLVLINLASIMNAIVFRKINNLEPKYYNDKIKKYCIQSMYYLNNYSDYKDNWNCMPSACSPDEEVLIKLLETNKQKILSTTNNIILKINQKYALEDPVAYLSFDAPMASYADISPYREYPANKYNDHVINYYRDIPEDLSNPWINANITSWPITCSEDSYDSDDSYNNRSEEYYSDEEDLEVFDFNDDSEGAKNKISNILASNKDIYCSKEDILMNNIAIDSIKASVGFIKNIYYDGVRNFSDYAQI